MTQGLTRLVMLTSKSSNVTINCDVIRKKEADLIKYLVDKKHYSASSYFAEKKAGATTLLNVDDIDGGT